MNNTVASTFAAYLAASQASDAAHKASLTNIFDDGAYRAACLAEAALHAARSAWHAALDGRDGQ